jgi:hypothetical protein
VKPAAELTALVAQRTWDKELILWFGPESGLRAALGPVTVESLDLLDLFDVDALPNDDGGIRERIVLGLREKLRSIRSGPARRVVLVVKSIGLLARYRTGLKELFDWFLGDFALAVLLLEGTVEDTRWPEEIRCDSDRLFDAFNLGGSVKNVYGESG